MRESSTSFYRRIALPEQADESGIEASFTNGVLTVIVPFRALPAPRKVAIATGSGTASAAGTGGTPPPPVE